MAEYLFSTNEFNKPSSVSGAKQIAVDLIRLLLLDPGDDRLHPNMGVGLLSRYAFCTDDDLSSLNTDIQKQVITYLPSASGTAVDCTLTDGKLNVSVTIDNAQFNFEDVLNNGTFDGLLSSLIIS